MTGPTQYDGFAASYHSTRVFLTGHTGFKGSWMALWLHALGAKVSGFALPPPTVPSLFRVASIRDTLTHVEADVRDSARLHEALAVARPQIVFHFAAQSIVRTSYEQPLVTLDTNVMGTAHLLEAVRSYASPSRPCAVVVVTSDKCYENRESPHDYREEEPMGGRDPYSMSKGASELVVSCWRRSYFPTDAIASHGVRLASVRAGNVIGGGDWAKDRILTDCFCALATGTPIAVRNPLASRPWQHVLEPLSGYLHVGARLLDPEPRSAAACAEGWNFGPSAESVWTVARVVDEVIDLWGAGEWRDQSDPQAPHEAKFLALCIEKALHRLGWAPIWNVREGLRKAVEWFQAFHAGAPDMRALTLAQIAAYTEAARDAGAIWATSGAAKEPR